VVKAVIQVSKSESGDCRAVRERVPDSKHAVACAALHSLEQHSVPLVTSPRARVEYFVTDSSLQEEQLARYGANARKTSLVRTPSSRQEQRDQACSDEHDMDGRG